MGRFDWASDGIFDIAQMSDAEFKAYFNRLTAADKLDILDALDDESEENDRKKKAVDFVTKAGTMLLRIGTLLT